VISLQENRKKILTNSDNMKDLTNDTHKLKIYIYLLLIIRHTRSIKKIILSYLGCVFLIC